MEHRYLLHYSGLKSKLGRNWTFSLQITFRSRSWTELRSHFGKQRWTTATSQTLPSGALCLTFKWQPDFQPNVWNFGLEKKISITIVEIINNFRFLSNLPEFLKKIFIKSLTFEWFWCLLALVYILCRYGILASIKLVELPWVKPHCSIPHYSRTPCKL